MEGGEKWRTMRCGGGASHDKWIINRIMLRFRPIAPKPANGGQDSSSSGIENKNMLSSKRRVKRKYVRVSKKNQHRRSNNNRKVSSPDQDGEDGVTKKVVTLQLLPERSEDLKDLQERRNSWCNLDLTVSDTNNNEFVQESNNNIQDQDLLMWLKLDQPFGASSGVSMQDQAVVMEKTAAATAVVESWVTVECVTETNTCILGCTDVDRVNVNLEKDSRPGFISDSWNNVQWVNGAYRRMVVAAEGNGGGWSPEMKVWLVIKEKLLPYLHYYSTFTCWIRLQYMWHNNRCSKMVPCDVWKLNSHGGFAWRLDLEAALTLGR